MEHESTKEKKQQKVELSTGQILKQAREKKGISINELADMIRVPLNVIEAIELDRIPKNLPETFIRGYIRAYAKKVDVEESQVLTSIDSNAVAEPIVEEMQSFSRRTKRQALEKRLAYASYAVIGVIIIASIIWWVQDTENTDIAPVVTTETEESVQNNETTNVIPQAEQRIEAKPVESVVQPSVEQPVETQLADTNANVNQQPLQLTPAEKAMIADNGEVDEEGFMKVEMSFSEDCWVDVSDVHDERIAIGNKPAGYVMTLNAQGPLRVVLGHTNGVKIWVNGKEFDTSDLPKNRVARFELEPQ